MSGRASRDKGQRGERRACDFFESIGIRARKVGDLETGTYGKTLGWDVELGPEGIVPWKVQAKEVGRFPSPAEMLEKAHVAFVHMTHGKLRGRNLILIDADDLA